MSQLFFQGYGWWIFNHVKAQRKFLITPLSSDYNESSYRNNFLLFGYSEGEDGIIGESSFRMQGIFDLTGDDEFAYKKLGRDFEPDRKLLPCSTYDGTIYRSGSAFEIFNQLRPWGLRIKEEDCCFIIDKEKPFKFKIEDPEIADEPVNTTIAIPSEISSSIAIIEPFDSPINYVPPIPTSAISQPDFKTKNIRVATKRDNQLHQLIWRVYQSIPDPTAQKVWNEIKNRHSQYDTDDIIQEVTSEYIDWCSGYGNERRLKRSTFDKTLSNLKKKSPL